jgi:general secretion pathway protein K
VNTRLRQRGGAILLAMLILTLVASLAAGMVWQQYRAIQVEAAERARTQAGWILQGALDWARLILREDARTGGADHLGEPWAVPLAEARLSSFLAAERGNAVFTEDEGLQAFLSGQISDAQARYNLRQLVDDEGKLVPAQVQALQRLCEAAGAPSDTASRLAEGLRAAWAGEPAALLAPQDSAELLRFGIDAAALARLRDWVVLLPQRTPLNLNTAPREVIAAAVDGLDLASAERIVSARARTPFTSLAAVQTLLPGVQLDANAVGVASRYFEVRGRLRLEQRVLEERSLVERRQLDVVALSRQRVNGVATP